jgi:nitrogen fixation-related uncharacterized protein
MRKQPFLLLLSFFLFTAMLIPANSFGQFDKLKKAGSKVLQDKDKKEQKAQTQDTEKQATATIPVPAEKIIYVSPTGSNRNDGSKANPLKNIDKAMKMAGPTDKIYIAAGVYSGTFNVGYLQSDQPVQLYGSWDENFTTQDIVAHPTLFQPDNASAGSGRKALLLFEKEVGGTVIDGIVWDMGERNLYDPKDGYVEGIGGRLRLPTEPITGMNSTVGEPCIAIRSGTKGGDITIQNCVFVNGASFGVQIGHRSGKVTIRNNVFVANKMAAIEVFGTCSGSNQKETMVSCGDVEIAHNTILFTWSRLKDMMDMGYGVRIMTKCNYDIHDNIIGASVMSGVDNSRFCKDDFVRVDNNLFFGNKKGDLEYFPASNVEVHLKADQFDDLEFASVSANENRAIELPVNQTYLTAFVNARYSEEANWDPNSRYNQWARLLGMNQQGTLDSQVSMFMNKYPWKETLLLFGANSQYGAQKMSGMPPQ